MLSNQRNLFTQLSKKKKKKIKLKQMILCLCLCMFEGGGEGWTTKE